MSMSENKNKILTKLQGLFKRKENTAQDVAEPATDVPQEPAAGEDNIVEPEKAPSGRHIPSGDAADAPQATEGVPLVEESAEPAEETDNLQGSLREGAVTAQALRGDAVTEGALRQNDLQRDIFSEPDNSACSFRLPTAATYSPSQGYASPDGGKDAEESDEERRESSPRPTENDEIIPPVGVADGAESVVSATDSLSKSAIADYLTATYGEDVAVNVRADFNSTGLKLADTHFLLVQMQDGEKIPRKKQFCIVYVYHTQPDLTIVLLHLTPEAAENLNAQGITVFESKFPRTTFGAWYELDVTPDTPDETVWTAIDAAVVACGGPVILRRKPQDDVAVVASDSEAVVGNELQSLPCVKGGGAQSATEGLSSPAENAIPDNAASALTLTKPAIAAYLTATYGDGIETANRPDKTKTGLLCADNYYSTVQMVEGVRTPRKKHLCFVYLYRDEDKNLLRMLLKTTPAHADMLREKHPAISEASFPRTTTEPWFEMNIDDTYTVGDLFDAIDGAKRRLDNDLAPLVRTIVEAKVQQAAPAPAPDVWLTELLTKQSVANYLSAAFGDGVSVNTRPDKTATGLPLADTHYTNTEMVDGELRKRKKPLCFAYVYATDTGVTVLLRTTAALLAKLMQKHPEVAPSPFPRTAQGQWFSLPANADWQPIELYSAIVDAKIECDGGTPDQKLVRPADEEAANDAAPATEPLPVTLTPAFRVEAEAETALEPDQIRESVSYREADKALSDADVAAMTGKAKRKCNPNDRGVVNLDILCRYFAPGESVTLNEIKVRVKGFNQGVTYLKVLTGGTLDRALCVEADEFSPIAAKMILLAGGKVYITRK